MEIQNSNIEEKYLSAYLSRKGYTNTQINKAIYDLKTTASNFNDSLYTTNKNVVVVFVNGRPLAEPWIKENIPAVIEAWEPGAMGGTALAEIIAGKVNPSGKLTVTIPYSVGQITSIYNHKPMHFFHKYIDEPVEPLWAFGFGLSYSTFNYSNMKIEKNELKAGEPVNVTIDVENTSNTDGDEIVQLYIRDNFSTLTRPVKELKDYKRVSLKAGEKKSVAFTIPFKNLGFYNLDDKYVVEPGEFTIMVGSSSNNKSLQNRTINVLE